MSLVVVIREHVEKVVCQPRLEKTVMLDKDLKAICIAPETSLKLKLMQILKDVFFFFLIIRNLRIT